MNPLSTLHPARMARLSTLTAALLASACGGSDTNTAEAPAPAPAPMPSAAQSPLASEAGMCLEWYRPRLRDPAGAYYTEPSKQGRVLSITVHATNGYGGYVTKRAACEIHNGKLNPAWTKTHAERGDW